MPYGTIKVDTITFTAGGVDTSVSISGLVQNPTFTGNITSTGTISGNIIRGGTTVSGATVTGTAGQFGTLTGNTAGFTTVTGATVTGTTANFVTVSGTTVTGSFGNFTFITGATVAITSGVFASGTAAAPSITFTGDVDTGVFTSAANQVSFTTSGTERLRIDGTGQIEAVSLGTAAAPVFSFTTDPDTGIYSPAANELAISTGGSGRLFVDASGRVGMGAAEGTYAASVTTTGNNGFLVKTGTASAVQIYAGNTGGESALGTLTSDPLNLITAGSSRIRITSAGLVGVGTSSPVLPLTVAGAIAVGGAGNNGIQFYNASPTATALRWLIANNQGDSDKLSIYRYDSSGNFAGTPLVIDSSNRVGIGSSSVGDQLDVAAGNYRGITVKCGTTAHRPTLSFFNTADSLAAYIQASGNSLQFGAMATDYGGHTPRMTLTSTGLGIGTQSPGTYNANLAVYSAGGAFVGALHANASGTFPKASAISLGSDAVSYTYTTGGTSVALTGSVHIAALQSASSGAGTDIAFMNTSGGSVSEKARIDSSGRLLVGTSSAAYYDRNWTGTGWTGALFVAQNAEDGVAKFHQWSNGGSLNSYGGASIFISRCKSGTVGTHTGGSLANGEPIGRIAFNGSDGTGFYTGASIDAVVDAALSGGEMPSRLVFSTTADGASSPTERMRITNVGDCRFGTTSANPVTGNVTGVIIGADTGGSLVGYVGVSRMGGPPMGVNRGTNDGNLIEFLQDGAQEGTISVSGTTVSYNGAHLSRWSQLTGIDPYDKTVRPEILRGTVMSNLDEMCDWTCPTSGDCQNNEQLNKTKISDVEGDKNVAGVFQSWDDDDDTWVNDFYLAMTGDFVIRIAAGTTVQRGDLLMSAGDGTAKPQDDDIIRSKTIAKVTSTNVSCTYDDGSYCVPCVLMAC